MICKICSCRTEIAFCKKVLGSYNVTYYRCLNCRFLQTEEPYWLNQAYSSGAISALDTGILYRNQLYMNRTKSILLKIFNDFSNFSALDYGGGEGVFVRLMRDIGFKFFRQDVYAQNLYARFFDISDLPEKTKFDILTAFEVFEHLSDPISEIRKMFEYSDIVLFSTELQPTETVEDLENWWYLVPETGQHVSFYNEPALKEIAGILNLNFYTDHVNLHILSVKELENPFKVEKKAVNKKLRLITRIFNKIYLKFHWRKRNLDTKAPSSLTLSDFEFVREKLRAQKNRLK